jgi:sugar lactone lactonase YvrE
MKTVRLAAALGIALCAAASAQQITESSPPFTRADNYLKLPAGRQMGSTSSVAGDSKGNIWVVDRCGANDCAGSKLDPVMEFDRNGNFIKAFGAGQLLFPHGLFIDRADHIWVVDGHDDGRIGDDVIEYDQSGKVLRTLGTPGVAGNDAAHFHEPNAVLVAPNGDIFVGEGHTEGSGNARIVKFDASGRFLMQWGGHGSGPGQLEVPHCLAMDSAGRLFVGDRGNNRMDIFDQNGRFIASWQQFSRPSGCAIDAHDTLYVSDSESHTNHHPGWMRGVRIGSVRDGVVRAFIPDDARDFENMSTSGGEGIWADANGVIYLGEVGQKAVLRFTPGARK